MRHLFLFSLAVVTACGGTEAAAPVATDTPPDTALITAEAVRIGGFTLAAVREEPWRDAWHLPARVTLDPASTQPLGSIVEGRILEVRVFPGDLVHEGDVLATIHSHEVLDARQMLAAARANVIGADSGSAVAVAAAARAERLLEVKAVSQAEVERARATRAAAVASRDAAHAALEGAEALLEHLVGAGPTSGVDPHAALIRAPFAGVVTGRSAQPGQVVLVGQQLLTVARSGTLGVILRLPEEATASVRLGAQVEFTVPAYPGRSFTARVARIAPVVDSVSRAIEVWAPASADGQRALRAEMTADAELLDVGGDALTRVVPAGAVQLMDGDTVVVLAARLGEGMLIESRPVRVGRRTSQQVEILDGVAAGDSVLHGGAALGKAEILKRRGGPEGGH